MLAFQCKYDLDARCNFSFIGDKNTPTIEECKLCVEIRQMKLEKEILEWSKQKTSEVGE
jgi:hypothetical protein